MAALEDDIQNLNIKRGDPTLSTVVPQDLKPAPENLTSLSGKGPLFVDEHNNYYVELSDGTHRSDQTFLSRLLKGVLQVTDMVPHIDADGRLHHFVHLTPLFDIRASHTHTDIAAETALLRLLFRDGNEASAMTAPEQETLNQQLRLHGVSESIIEQFSQLWKVIYTGFENFHTFSIEHLAEPGTPKWNEIIELKAQKLQPYMKDAEPQRFFSVLEQKLSKLEENALGEKGLEFIGEIYKSIPYEKPSVLGGPAEWDDAPIRIKKFQAALNERIQQTREAIAIAKKQLQDS